MTALLSIALKGAVVLLAAALGTRLLRRAPASTRHGVWAVAFAALVLLPAMEAAGPRWSVGVLPAAPVAPPPPPLPPVPPALPPLPPDAHTYGAADAGSFENDMAAFDNQMAVFDSRMETFDQQMASFDVEMGRSELTEARPSLIARAASRAGWLAALWAAGALAVALGWLAATLAARSVVAGARPETDEEWAVAAERARRLAGLAAPVRLLRSDALDVPVAWGWGRGAVVLPACADAWDDDRRDAVLLHEMAHLARRDAWSQAVAQAALAVHWANPLAWWGYRRLLDAREQACDDAVLRGGARPSAYAAHLVGVARSVRRGRLALAAVAPMARTAPIEARVASILDPVRQRRPMGRRATAATAALAAAVCVPLAALQPVARAGTPPDSDAVWTAAALDTLDVPVAAVNAEADSPDAAWGEIDAAVERSLASSGAHAEAIPPARPTPPAARDRRRSTDRGWIDMGDDINMDDLEWSLDQADQEIEDARAEIRQAIRDVEREGGPAGDLRAHALRQAEQALAHVDRQAIRDGARAQALHALGRLGVLPVPPTPPVPPVQPVPPTPGSVDWSDVDQARRAAQRRRSP